jgi:hypothetical protein
MRPAPEGHFNCERKDSVSEFRLITNAFDAEYGRFSGAVMNAITKSGTNSIHGSAFDFLRNSDLDSHSFLLHYRAPARFEVRVESRLCRRSGTQALAL